MVRIDADDVLTMSWQRALLFPLERAHQRMRPNLYFCFTGRCCIPKQATGEQITVSCRRQHVCQNGVDMSAQRSTDLFERKGGCGNSRSGLNIL
jgi:hypothetical protein